MQCFGVLCRRWNNLQATMHKILIYRTCVIDPYHESIYRTCVIDPYHESIYRTCVIDPYHESIYRTCVIDPTMRVFIEHA